MPRTLAAARQRSFGAGCAAQHPNARAGHPAHGTAVATAVKVATIHAPVPPAQDRNTSGNKNQGLPEQPNKTRTFEEPPARPPAPRARASGPAGFSLERAEAARGQGGRLSDNSVRVAARRTAGFERQPPPERPPVPTFAPRPPRRVPGRQSLPPRETSGPKLPPAPTGHPGHPRS